MRLTRYFLNLLFVLVFCSVAYGQTPNKEATVLKEYKLSKDSSKSVSLLITLSELSYQRDRPLSEKIAEHAFQLSKTIDSKELQIEALTRLTNVTFENSNNSKAIELTSELLKRVEDLGIKKYFPEANRIAGRNYHLRGDYSTALGYYFKGLKYCEETEDTVQMGELHNIIGGVYLNQADYKNAYRYYNKSLQFQIQNNNVLRIGRGYLNISETYLGQKKYVTAKQMLDSALVNYTRINYDEGIAMVYTNLPELFIAENKDDSALKYLDLAYDFLKSKNKTYYIPQIDLKAARLLLKKKNTEAALYRIESGIKAGLLNRQNHDLAPLFLLKSEILDLTGQTKEAFKNFKLYKMYSDSVLNAASIKKQTEEALKYDYAKKEYQQEIEEQEKENQRRSVLIGSVVLLLILFFLFYYRYQLKQKANRILEDTNTKLAEKNELIEEKSKELKISLDERELLLKEIHHRVKNNLQTISGLLELQKEELTEEGSKAAFDEGQSRVRSISLIHQNLYQNDNLGNIQFKTFVKDLSAQVKEVFEVMDRKMDISMDMPDKILDIDTAVPLGLIINELLTNSYKYATRKNETGKIWLHLKDLKNGTYVLTYSDTGPGIKTGVNFESASSLGLRLIKGLSGQLAGTATYSNEKGSEFTITFKDTFTRQKE